VSRELSQEWIELLEDKYIPNNWNTKFEILNLLSIQYGTEEKYEEALETSQKVIEMIKANKQIGIQRRRFIYDKPSKKREVKYLIKLDRYDEASDKAEKYFTEGTFDEGHKLDIIYEISKSQNELSNMLKNRMEKINLLNKPDYPYREDLAEQKERLLIDIITIYKNDNDLKNWERMREFLYEHQKKHNLRSEKKLMVFAKNLLKAEEKKGEHKEAYKYREDINEYISDIISDIEDKVINPRSKEYPYEKIKMADNEHLDLESNQIRDLNEKEILIKEQGRNNWDMALMAAKIANKEDNHFKSYYWNKNALECISRNLEKLKKGILNVVPGEKVHAEKYEIYLKEAAESALKIAKSFQNKGGMEANKGMDWRRKRYGHLEKISDDITIDLEEEYSEVLELYRDLLKKMEEEEYSKGNIKKVKTDMEQFIKKYGIEKRD